MLPDPTMTQNHHYHGQLKETPRQRTSFSINLVWKRNKLLEAFVALTIFHSATFSER